MKFQSLKDFQDNKKKMIDEIKEFKSNFVNLSSIDFSEDAGNDAVIRVNEGVKTENIVKAVEDNPELLDYINNEERDKASLYNDSCFNNGLFFHIKENKDIRIDIESARRAVVRNLFLIDEGVECSITCRVSGTGSLNLVNSIYVKKASSCRFGTLNLSSSVNSILNHGTAEQDAKLDFYNANFGTELTRAYTKSYLKGDSASSNIVDVYSCSKGEMELAAMIYCSARNNNGRVFSKGIVKNTGNVYFNGFSRVEREAEEADVFVDEHAIIMNKGAKANLVPTLEIETNNLKAGHSASVAQFNEEKLFYLESRGLTEEESRKILIEGFLSSIVEKIPMQDMRKEVEKLL